MKVTSRLGARIALLGVLSLVGPAPTPAQEHAAHEWDYGSALGPAHGER